MSSSDEFLERLMEAFLLEAEEHVQNITSDLIALCAGPVLNFGDLVDRIYLNVHTLKGASRAVNFLGLEAICQALESGISSWRHSSGTVQLSSEQISLMEEVGGKLRLALSQGLIFMPDPEWLKRLTAPGSVIQISEQAAIAIEVDVPAETTLSEPEKPSEESAPLTNGPATLHMPESIRVHTSRLETMAFLADELTQLRQDLKQAARFVEECQSVWGELREKIATGENSEGIMRLNEFLRSAGSTINHSDDRMRRSADEIASTAHDLLRMPASTLLDQVSYMARHVAVSLGKQVDVQVIGGDMRMDKRILEELKDALIHLVRNAVDHGLEDPIRRGANGKPLSGLLVLSVEEVGSGRLRISIRDDGKGIDPDEMRQSVKRFAKVPVAQMTDEEAVEAIFLPDMTTRSEVTSLSGRGVGMSIVRQKVQQLGGTVSVKSRVGVGTELILTLPSNLASFRGLTVEIRDHRFIIPVVSVVRSLRVRRDELRMINERETLLIDGEVIVAAKLGGLLNLDGEVHSAGDRSALLLEQGERRILLFVDSFTSDEEMLPRPFGFPLTNSEWWSGAALTGTRLLPILSVENLYRRLDAGVDLHPASITLKETKVYHILVAEDSITSRMLLKGILESSGYRVKTSNDGLEAWEKLQQAHFDAVVSDIEMPRMDGFALVERIRADTRYEMLPIVLVSALSKQEDRERGLSLGASAYIIKSNFEESGLIQALERLL